MTLNGRAFRAILWKLRDEGRGSCGPATAWPRAQQGRCQALGAGGLRENEREET